MSQINAVELYTENEITLYDVDGVVMTTTESIAKKFGKRKDSIDRNLKSLPDYHELISSTKVWNTTSSESNKIITYIDRDVMTLLVMGLNNTDSVYMWKKQYIEAFNLMEKKLCKPVEPKVISAFTDEELKLLNKVSDGLLDIKDAIIKSKQQPSLQQPTEEVKEALVIVEDRKEKKKLKKSFKKNTDSKYYNLKKQSIFSLRAKAPKDYKVHFEYYNDSEVIMTAIDSGNTYKTPSPEWVKQMGEFLPFSAVVTLRKTNKRGYLDLVKYID